MRIFRNPPPQVVHPPLAGSRHQVEVGPNRRWLVLSGQLGIQPDGAVPDDPVEQLRIALENVRRNLFAGDMQVTDVIKLTVHLVGEVDVERCQEVVAGWLDGHVSTMTVLFVAGLIAPRFRVQLDVLAAQ